MVMKKPEEIAYFLLNLNQKEKKKYIVEILGKKFVVYPKVFSPRYFNDIELFARELIYIKGERMLEIGTGTGAFAILAVLKGKANRVIATDINPAAIKNVKENVRMYGLNRKIRVIKSDLFKKLKNEKFNIIFFNAPFCFTKKKKLTILEKALFDYNYKTLNDFIYECKKHVTERGRIFLGFSSFFGDIVRLYKIANYHKKRIKVIKQIKTKRNGQQVTLEILEII